MSARALVVVSYGSSRLLEHNLSAWSAGREDDWLVVVVDNPTTPEERRRVRRLADAHGWVLVTPARNLGFGDGCRAGVAAVADRTLSSIVLLNPDARLDRATAHELAARVEESTDLMLAPRMLRSDGRASFTATRLDPRTGRGVGSAASGVPWLTGACLAMSAAAWTRLDGIASEYFLYWEDVDLGWRWHQQGGRSEVAADLTCVHDPGGTQGAARTKSALYYYYNCRNRLLFARRHLSPGDRARWALHAPAYACEVVLRGGRRQLVRPWRNALPAARGTFDGLWALVRPAARASAMMDLDSASATQSGRTAGAGAPATDEQGDA